MRHDGMREPPRRENDAGPKDPRNDTRQKSAMRARGWQKVVLVTLVANQVLTAAFSYVAQQVDPGLTLMPTFVFCCATSALVSYWLLVDARNAWRHAKEKGYIGSGRAEKGDALPMVVDHCPKRWLVVLHIELHPELAGTL